MTGPGGVGLRARLVALLLATLIPLVGLGGYWILSEFREERARIGHQVQERAELVAAQVGHSVGGVQERLAVLARLPAVRTGNRQEIERLFQDLLADAPHLQNLGLAAPDGTIMVSAVPVPPGRPVSLGDREWLQRVVRWGEPAVGGFQVGRITGNPDVILAHPVLDGQGRLAAVIYAGLDLVYASRAVTGAYPGVPLVWAVVDEQGLVLLHSGPETTGGKPLGPLPGMLRGETIVPGTTWHCVVAMPADMATAQVRGTFFRIGLPAGLILLISAGVGLGIAYRTWRPIRDLTSAVRRVGTGESTVWIPVQAGGEVGELATTLAETLGAVDRRRRELAALLEAGRAIASSLDLEQSLQAIVQQATIISGMNFVRLLLLDEEAQVLRYGAVSGLPPEEERNVIIPIMESFSGGVVATRKPLAVADTRGDPRNSHPEHATKYGLVSYLGLPVKLGDRILGVMVFNTTSPHTYSDDEIAYLSAFADQAAIAIENAHLYDAAQRELAERARTEAAVRTRTQQLETVRAIGAEIIRELDLRAVLDLITGRAVELVGASTGMLRLWDEEAGLLLPQSWVGLGERRGTLSLRLGEGVAGAAAERRQGLIVNDFRHSPYATPQLLELTTHTAVLAEPLLYRDRLVGVITLNREERGRDFGEEDRQLLALFAAQAAIAIENARLLQEERDRRRQLEAVRVVTEEIARELDLSAALGLITRGAADLMGTSFGVVYLWDEATEVLAPRAWRGFGEWISEVRLRLGDGVAGAVAQRREGLIVNDYPASPYAHPLFVDRAGITAVLAEPLLYRDRLVGVIAIGTDKHKQPFSPQHRETLALFGAQAAIAIENARLYEVARRELVERTQAEEALAVRTRYLEAIRSISEEITCELDLKAVLTLIIHRAVALVGATSGTIRLWNQEQQLLIREAQTRSGTHSAAVPLRLAEGVAGAAAEQRRGLIVNDYRTSAYAIPALLKGTTHTAVMATPLLYRERLVGVVSITRDETDPPFSEANLEVLVLFAAQAAIAIENARLYEATRRVGQEAQSLYEVAHSLTTSLDPREVLHLISVKTTELLGTPHAQVVLWDEETKTLRFGAAYGTEAEEVKQQVFRLGEGVNGIVAETRKPLLVNDYQRFPKRRLDMTDLVAVIGVPLLYRGRLLGVLTSHATQAGTMFTEDHLALLTSFANQAAIAIENARLYEEIRRHAGELETRVRQRTAELEEALRVKVEFLGKMSHELRTPLNFILGFSDLLQQGTGGPLTPKQATYLDRIQGGGRRLLSLVSDVLDIAQLDAGKIRLRLEPVILAPLVQEILGLVQIQVSQKRLKATTALDPWMPFIVADRFKLAQILHNLVSNAVKFTPEGGSIRVTTRQVPGSGSTGAGEHGSRGESAPQPPGATAPQQFVEITVEDTGIGIQPESLETVFEAFYQVDGSETRAQGGAGLGLALVRKLVELHGGWVWAESAGPGQGSRFVVRLPRLEVPKAKRILLAEDEALIRIPIASALESAGFAVVGVATGADALAVMEAEAFDLLILDVVLPDMEGWEILRRVREMEEIRSLPVLVVTGLESLNAEQALALGADEFLTKPVSPRVLVDTVVRLLASSAASSAGVGPRPVRAGERPEE